MIFKKGRSVLYERVPVKYAFIRDNRKEFPICPMCRILKVNSSGFYRWLKIPESSRTKENKKLTELIRFYWEESGQVYGSPNIHEDLKKAGYTYSVNKVARLMRKARIKGAYRRKRHQVQWVPGEVYLKNTLNKEFAIDEPNQAWCTDITYIRTH